MAFSKKWASPTGTKTYYAWRSMRSRCTSDSNPSYKNYGARGVKVCDRWLNDYDAFLSDMGEAPEGMTLDRIDVDGDYTPENCRWADWNQQASNKRNNVVLSLNGVEMTQAEWARKLEINVDTLWRRINVYKMPLEKALVAGSLVPEWNHGTKYGYSKGCKCDECKAAHAAHHREQRAKRKAKASKSGELALG